MGFFRNEELWGLYDPGPGVEPIIVGPTYVPARFGSVYELASSWRGVPEAKPAEGLAKVEWALNADKSESDCCKARLPAEPTDWGEDGYFGALPPNDAPPNGVGAGGWAYDADGDGLGGAPYD